MKRTANIFILYFIIILTYCNLSAQNILKGKSKFCINLGCNLIIPVVKEYHSINDEIADASYDLTIKPFTKPGLYFELSHINPIKKKGEYTNFNWSYGIAYKQQNYKLNYKGEFETESGSELANGTSYVTYSNFFVNIKLISNFNINKYQITNRLSYNLGYVGYDKYYITNKKKINTYLNYEIGVVIPVKNKFILIPYISSTIIDFKRIIHNNNYYYTWGYWDYKKKYLKEFTFGVNFIFLKPLKNIENENK